MGLFDDGVPFEDDGSRRKRSAKKPATAVFASDVELMAQTHPPLASELPLVTQFGDLPIVRLLQFLPDVRLKAKVTAAEMRAKAADVTSVDGLQRADAEAAGLRLAIAEAREAFEFACDLANKLHKRLTGLRADFIGSADETLARLNGDIYRERKRLEEAAEQERQVRQAAADAEARRATEQAAREAKKQGAQAEIVAALKAQAKTATAPPVAAPPVPVLTQSSTVERWKARLRGTLDGEEPNPKTEDMTPEQRLQLIELLKALIAGRAALALVQVDWSRVNKRAAAEKSTLDIPGLEAFDVGGVRGKARR